MNGGVSMYCAYDGKHVIAFHDEKRVVEVYCYLIEKYHHKKIDVCFIKDKKIKYMEDISELYLVQYGDSYIQAGYVQYLEFSKVQIDSDHIQARDNLLQILELYDLSKSDTKKINGAIEVITKIIQEDSEYIPELSYLKRIKLEYDPYIYNKGIWN